MVAREHAYAERIAKAVLDVAHSNRAQKVKNIEIGVGMLSGVDTAVMSRLVSELLMGSVAEGAYITTVLSPASIVCGICQYSGTPDTTGCGREALASCPKCRKSAVTVHGGVDVGLRRIEMDLGRRRSGRKKKPIAKKKLRTSSRIRTRIKKAVSQRRMKLK